MKKKPTVIAAIALVIILVLGVVLLLTFQIPDYSLSKEQSETIKALGYPNQFVISYYPQGEDDVVRTEYWYYPDYSMEITFLDGEIYVVEEYKAEDKVAATPLRPEDYDLYTTLAEIEVIFGEAPPEPTDFLPGFYEPGELETYISTHAIFVIEQDYLTYFQTMGVSEE